MSLPDITICIVGAGPRGISVLERVRANHLTGTRVVVHVVDPYPPGPGSVWRTSQSGHLLMNTVASQVSMFTDDSVSCAGPIVPGPSLYEWARTIGPDAPDARLEAGRLGPDSYPSRSLCGHYLEWVFGHLVATAPDTITIRTHRATAIALDDEDGGQVVTLHDGTRLTGLDSVVLAVGHGPVSPTRTEAALTGFAAAHRLRHVLPSNPADVDLRGIKAGERIALRGLGLNFFDYLALLTEGRGGRFARYSDGLVYLPSGQEPFVYAGSRRGIPHHARGENQKGPVGRHQPRFLTADVVAGLRHRGSVRFLDDLWPLIDKEVRTVYYHTLVSERGNAGETEDFLAAYVECLHADVDDVDVLKRFGIGRSRQWDWDLVARPYSDAEFAVRRDFHRWLLDYLREDVAQARRGNVRSPLKAALDVLRDLRNEIRLVVDHGGIPGGSYRDELTGWYTPLNAFLSIGPPLSRIEEMIALIEAGVLHMTGPGMRVRPAPHGTGFLVDSTSVSDPAVLVTTLIEARIPEVDLRRSTDPLLRHLLATGQCRTYRMPDGDKEVPTGGLAVTLRPYRVIDAEHRPHPNRFAYGVPTESVHWVTAAGIRPGVGSMILEDADAIARAMLGCHRDGGERGHRHVEHLSGH